MSINLQKKAEELRYKFLEARYLAGSGHFSGILAVLDILTALYYGVVGSREKIYCGGYYYPGVYVILADLGYFPKEWLASMDNLGTQLLANQSLPGMELSSFSSLGQILSIANGSAYAKRLRKIDGKVYCLVGDGELNEGQIWESIATSAHYQLNIRLLVNCNKRQLDGPLAEVKTMNLEKLFDAYGWKLINVDGHYVDGLVDAIESVSAHAGPVAFLAQTMKGKGFSEVEAHPEAYHAITLDQMTYQRLRLSSGIEA